jgi:hypothetical protein
MSNGASVWDPAGQEIPVVNANSTLYPQVYAATAGQTHFVITNFVFTPGTGSLLIFVQGVFQIITKNFTEGTDGASFDMTTTELQAGDEVVALGFVGIVGTTPPTIAANITYGGTTLADILLNHSELIVNSYTQLRAVQHIFWSFAYLTGAVVRGDGLGGGFYYYDATDTTSPDNGSTIIVATDGGRWKLISTNAGIVTQPIGDNTTNPATTKFVQQSHTSALTHMIHPSNDGKWRDLYKAGVRPAFHQQQWGGGIVGYELLDGATDTVTVFDSATGQIEDINSLITLGAAAGSLWRGQGFKVAETLTLQAIWVKLAKVANPVDNVKVTICLDNGSGLPVGFVGITNGVSGQINGKQITAKADGEWYRFVFATPPTLTTNLQYNIALTRSGAVDATNYYVVKSTLNAASRYPFALSTTLSDGTTWSAGTTGSSLCFLVEPVVANQMFRTTGGLVDTARFVMNEGSQLNQSKVFCDRLVNFADSRLFTQLLRVSDVPLGKTIFDYGLGINHDRIVLTCDLVTGFARLSIYNQAKAVTTIVSTVTITGASLMDIGIIVRTAGDGTDYAQIWLNGVLATQATALTLAMSPLMRDLGTRWIGGGFPIAPGWTQDMNFTSQLPSAQGWTYGGTATEANVFQVANSKLYQNKDGYAATDTGFYTHAATGFNNSIGWIVRFRLRDLFSDNVYTAAVSSALTITVNDGTKTISLSIHEYFIWSGSTATDFIAQMDTKTWDTEFVICGKLTDYYVFANNRLIIDGTGKLLVTTASNTIVFGDTNATSGENADAVWTDFSYYNGGLIAPSVATGMSLHETGYISGDWSAYLPAIYNGGTNPVSIKRFWNQSRNYVQEIPWIITTGGVQTGLTVAASTFPVVADLPIYALGDKFKMDSSLWYNTASGGVTVTYEITIDGNPQIQQKANQPSPVGLAWTAGLSISATVIRYSGLHSINTIINADSGVGLTLLGTSRSLIVIPAPSSY